MHSHPTRRIAVAALLALWPLLQAQAQTPSGPPEASSVHCARPPHPPHPPRPPRPTAEQRERHLQKSLALNAEQAKQLDALLSQALEQGQPPDEARLAQLLNAEQRQRLRELQPPAPPPLPPMPEAPAGCEQRARATPPAQPAPKASSAAKPAG
ncbi:hypothetical protein H5407_17160 [Mitsuaria sp. WAJ17]|uniref:hypothetical protein n=1 Tax=Mitsuaria sp. WAJ17 TaxID=2761452 RepID=UPI001601F39E|nr:hypothetical protein [Mitsuaria sp. WAJ17]MBB2486961.1 hypothetical protein [Mitsuaria sp. WAJ17]